MTTAPITTPARTVRDLVNAVDRLSAAFIVIDVLLARLPARDPRASSAPGTTKRTGVQS